MGPAGEEVNVYNVAWPADTASVTWPPASGRIVGDAVKDEIAGEGGCGVLGGAGDGGRTGQTAPGETKIHFSPRFQTWEAHEAMESRNSAVAQSPCAPGLRPRATCPPPRRLRRSVEYGRRRQSHFQLVRRRDCHRCPVLVAATGFLTYRTELGGILAYRSELGGSGAPAVRDRGCQPRRSASDGTRARDGKDRCQARQRCKFQ